MSNAILTTVKFLPGNAAALAATTATAKAADKIRTNVVSMRAADVRYVAKRHRMSVRSAINSFPQLMNNLSQKELDLLEQMLADDLAQKPKAKARTLKVALPDGTTATRRTARDYTHVLASSSDGETWGAFSWHGSHKLALRAMEHRSSCWPEAQFRIVAI